MDRSWVVIAKVKDLIDIPPLNRLWYAESNSPNEEMRLSGDPDVLEAVQVFIKSLPATYDRGAAIALMIKAVDAVFEC